ncbi:hypothetical protein pEaSNUABM37_00289 [Erwinia phage pEa_SNUABM_37]|nr:hypothetical protein pEaSNUABM37_00289 [Erwinia phage pEa_SNUABM_37]QXO10757.1 hypothetical protein pEaSNUABM48_00289 [Erwinia phage pEa_SNUABM_48]
MAMNHDYYTLVHNYVLKKGMDRVDAEDIATSLAVLIPMRHDFGKAPDHHWPYNSHVVTSITKLHQGKDYKRIVPYDLDIPVIKLDSFDDLPQATTYGQRYYIRRSNTWLETKPNGTTEVIDHVMTIEVDEPLFVDKLLLDRLREGMAQRGITLEIWKKDDSHPNNVLGLAQLRAFMAGESDRLITAELKEQRAADQGCWSKPTDRIKFRDRPTNRLTRMRNRKRG